ncbi:tol-pal system protein YbgF [Pseudomonas sp. HK3]|jgi:tol-pal system protein YbgF
MFKLASFKWAPLALCVMGANFANADTWSSLDNAKGVPVTSVAQAPAASNNANKGLSTAASQMLFSEIEMLKQEIQSLRSTVEKQGYELNKLKTEQKQRYLDLDRRMSQMLEGQSASTAPVAGVTVGDGQAEYDAAFSLMKQRKLDEAAIKFKSFLQAFPKSELAVNGYYWLGQIYYNQGNLEEARKAFTIVVNQYPNHQKTPDSAYKLGVVLHRVGDTAKSKTLLQSVVSKYSDSASARFAAKYLKDNFK